MPYRASCEWIAFVSGTAAADRVVIQHFAVGVDATRALARIDAVLVHAGQGLGAIRRHQALGPAVGRYAEVAIFTRAHSLVVVSLTLRVWAARAREAWIHLNCRLRCRLYKGEQGNRELFIFTS